MSKEKNSIWQNYKFPILLITSIIIGSLIGIYFGEKATVLKPLGDIFLNLMFTIVVPLVFFTIASAVANMSDLKRFGKIVGHMFKFFIITGAIASVVMIVAVNLYPPAKGVNINLQKAEIEESIDIESQIVSAVTVEDFPELISKNNMLPLIIFTVLFGISVNLVGEKAKPVVRFLNIMSEVFMKFINLIMFYAPIGLGAYFAALVGTYGPELLGSYARVMVMYYPLSIAYFFIAFFCYSYYAGGMEGVRRYFKNILPVAVTSLSTQSSIASLPVNTEATKRMGVPKDIRDIVLPIGATAHMEGTCLSSILKISFLFGIFGVPFKGIGTYLTAIFISVVGGVVMSGVPGGGFIGEMFIINLYGFPLEGFPIIATIGYLVDPPATMINVTGDAAVSMMVTRAIEGKDWLDRNLGEDKEEIEVEENIG